MYYEDIASGLINELARDGYRGVHLDDCNHYPANWGDFESDGKSREEFDAWRRDYALVTIGADLAGTAPGDRPYITVEIEWKAFHRDIRRTLRKRFGAEAAIHHNPNTSEWEIERTKQTA